MGDWPRPGQRVVSLSVPGHRCRLPPMCPRRSNASHHQPSPATDRRARPQPQRTPAIDYRQTLDYLVMSRSMLATGQLGEMTHNIPACYGLNGKWDGWSVAIETQSAMSPYTPHRTRMV
jgi:hypothetical protein